MRRDTIIDAAAKVFHERGYAGASMQDIADEVGILKGSIYHHVAGKEQLLFRLLDATQDGLLAIVDAIARLDGLTPLERLHEYIRRRVLFAGRNLGRMTIYHHDAGHLSPPHGELLAANRAIELRFLTELVDAAGTELDARAVATALRDCADWMFRWSPPGDELELLAETCATFLLGGASAPPGFRAATRA